MKKITDIVGDGWAETLEPIFSCSYMDELREQIKQAKQKHVVYPPSDKVFRAFKTTGYDDIKVVILGQDPYHDGSADGLAFSVPNDRRINPSLRNIKKAIIEDLGKVNIEGGDLTPWAQQGVLLLNCTLTVNAGLPNSHKDFNWKQFVGQVLMELSYRPDKPIVWMLWGSFAQNMVSNMYIPSHHLVLKAAHPAAEGYSGGKAGFFGCKHFSQANDFLVRHGESSIIW